MTRFTDPQMLKVLADVMTEIPLLDAEGFPWDIDGKKAQASYDLRFWRTGLIQPDDFLDIINTLKDEHGWKRGSTHADNGPAWILYAYTERDGYRVEISGSRLHSEGRLDGVDNFAIPFFAPPLPQPPKRWMPESPSALAWMKACDEHDERSRNHEW